MQGFTFNLKNITKILKAITFLLESKLLLLSPYNSTITMKIKAKAFLLTLPYWKVLSILVLKDPSQISKNLDLIQ